MKKLKYIVSLFFALTLLLACEETDYEFGDIVAPSNLQINTEIVGQDAANPYGDGTGKVIVSVSATNAISYKIIANGKETMVPTGTTTVNFSTTGVHKYVITFEAIGKAGVTSTTSTEVEVLALYEPPADLLEMLHGVAEKTWRIKAEAGGHFGVGPAEETSPIWWAANAYDKDGLGAYDDRLVFKADGTVGYISNGTLYGKAGPLEQDFGIAWEQNSDAEFENYPIDNFTDTWVLTAPDGQETLTFNDKGFHGFYVGGDHSYQILERTDTEMTLKTIGADGLAWFCILTSEEAPDNSSSFDTLIWSDEFDVDGAPSNANWTYDLGAGGWGNGEAQTYTDNAENVIVEGGVLKIIAKADGNGGYTSARVKTQGLQSFKYGRVEVRAKLPSAQGTWPAIWMLGDSFETIGWPRCGEIDIMEQTGQDKSNTLGTLHWFDEGSASNASYGETTAVADTSTEFHVYALEWTDESLKIFVDDVKFFEMANDATLPFNDNFFMILNIAMGGSLGGEIDAAFTEDIMEIDYVRVYQ